MVNKDFRFFEKDLPSARKRIRMIGKREGIIFGKITQATPQKRIAHIAGYKTFSARIKRIL